MSAFLSRTRTVLPQFVSRSRISYTLWRPFSEKKASKPAQEPTSNGEEHYVVLPPRTKPGETFFPAETAKLGDAILALNAIDASLLNDYIKLKLGLPDNFSFASQAAEGTAAPASGTAAPAEKAAEPEKTTFEVKLESFDAAAKIKVIKEVRTITNLGLKEAKEFVEAIPKVLKSNLKKDEAEKIIAVLKDAGAKAVMI